MTEGVDSLRTNASSESNIKPGHKNTEGTTICKVNATHQADQNSEPLCAEKPVQETGAEDLTGGKPERESYTEWGAKYAEGKRNLVSQERQQKICSMVDRTERDERGIKKTQSEDRSIETWGYTNGGKGASYPVARENARVITNVGTDYEMIEQKYC